MHQGQAAPAGHPATGSSRPETAAAPIEINTVVASGSSPRLMVAFQPAWQAAANRTAAKTTASITVFATRRHSGAPRSGEPGIHNQRPGRYGFRLSLA